MATLLLCACGRRRQDRFEICSFCRKSPEGKQARAAADREPFVCKGCHKTIARWSYPKKDVRKDFCSNRCKMKVWSSTHERKIYPPSQVLLAQRASAQADFVRRRAQKNKNCIQCGEAFNATTIKQRYCSNRCRVAGHSSLVKGKAYRLPSRRTVECAGCGRAFESCRTNKCQMCTRRACRDRYGSKHRDRARYFGVTFESGVTPVKVFDRDGWRCQLCGCKTPKRLRGRNLPLSPEVDHIVPLSCGGGHTWDNVQCACRSCNIKKATKILGQLRLTV